MSVSDLLQQHHDKLLNCSTQWVIYRKEFFDGRKGEWIKTQNHCNNRDCPHCFNHRLGILKHKLTEQLRGIRKVRHIVLTFGEHKELSNKNIDWCMKKNYQFIRKLNRKKKKYSVLSVLEIKKQSDGLIHYHVHNLFCGWSPNHITVAKEWEKTLGYKARTRTNYRASKKACINYFAKRCAGAGLDKTENEYMEFIHNRRVYRVVNSSFLVVSAIKSPEFDSEKDFYLIFVGILTKSQDSYKPPDDLTCYSMLTEVF